MVLSQAKVQLDQFVYQLQSKDKHRSAETVKTLKQETENTLFLSLSLDYTTIIRSLFYLESELNSPEPTNLAGIFLREMGFLKNY